MRESRFLVPLKKSSNDFLRKPRKSNPNLNSPHFLYSPRHSVSRSLGWREPKRKPREVRPQSQTTSLLLCHLASLRAAALPPPPFPRRCPEPPARLPHRPSHNQPPKLSPPSPGFVRSAAPLTRPPKRPHLPTGLLRTAWRLVRHLDSLPRSRPGRGESSTDAAD